MPLSQYKSKRDFSKTSEPKGKILKTSQKRFVIQLHQARAKHYDFRLEHNGVLISFAVPKNLSQNPKDKRLAVMVEPHPLEYIKFEGIIPKGNYGAGSVTIFDKGNYLPLEDFDKGLEKGHLKILLNGEKVRGAFNIMRLDEKNWLIIKTQDDFASSKSEKPKCPFKKISPQLATLTTTIPKGKNHLFEIKFDGYRIISFFQNGKAKLLTRNQKDYTKKLAPIADSLQKLREDEFTLDGEVVVFDKNGRTDFSMLQAALKDSPQDLVYAVFDILSLNGESLLSTPLLERKKTLEKLMQKAPHNMFLSTYIIGNGDKLFDLAKDKNLEGIIAKEVNAKYCQTRDTSWLKIKCYHRQEFVVCGFLTSEKNLVLSSLILGYYNKGRLIFAGKVGTGISDAQKQKFKSKFKKFVVKDSPIYNAPNLKNIVWLEPRFVCEVRYAEFTKENVLRQPSFIALREDKDPQNVFLEKPNEEK